MKYLNGIIDSINRGYNADAAAFFARVTAAGGTLTATEKTAVNTLVISLKSNNIWNSIVALYPMVGASAAACAQNLISSSYTGTFNGGWTYASTGVTPNGTNAYMNTNLIPFTALTQNTNHLSFYSRSNVAAGSATDFGSQNSSTNYFFIQIFTPGNLSYNLISTFSAPSVANTSSLGFFNSNRNNSTTVSNFKNGTNLGNTTQNSTTLNLFNVYLSAVNRDGLTQQYSTKQCAFASIGAGLSDTDAANFYTNVQTFQTSLSRQV